MGEDTDKLVRTIAVPSWMVYAFSGLLTVLSGGAVATVAIIVHEVFDLKDDHANTKRDVAAMQVKQADFTSMFNTMNATLNRLENRTESMDERLRRLMP